MKFQTVKGDLIKLALEGKIDINDPDVQRKLKITKERQKKNDKLKKINTDLTKKQIN